MTRQLELQTVGNKNGHREQGQARELAEETQQKDDGRQEVCTQANG